MANNIDPTRPFGDLNSFTSTNVNDAEDKTDKARRALKMTYTHFRQYMDHEDSSTMDDFFEKLLSRWAFVMFYQRHLHRFHREVELMQTVFNYATTDE